MAFKLTLEPEMSIQDGARLAGGRVFQYRVIGGPTGDSISIGEDAHTKRWRIYRNPKTGWTGDFASADEARSALEADLNRERTCAVHRQRLHYLSAATPSGNAGVIQGDRFIPLPDDSIRGHWRCTAPGCDIRMPDAWCPRCNTQMVPDTSVAGDRQLGDRVLVHFRCDAGHAFDWVDGRQPPLRPFLAAGERD